MVRLKFKNRMPFFPGDEDYDELEYHGKPVPEVLLDDEDLPAVLERQWKYLSRNGHLTVKNEKYLGRGTPYRDEYGVKKQPILKRHLELHRFVLGCPSVAVHAINGNYLDCRKENYTFAQRDRAAKHASGVSFQDVLAQEDRDVQ